MAGQLRAEDLRTPVYLVDEAALIRNLEILHGVEQRTGCHILLAQKAFSMFRVYPLVVKYLSGATASGLYEARLAHEEMGGENHVFCPAYTDEEMAELCKICDHISFNSLAQLEAHRPVWEKAGVSVGLRVNPEHSTQEGHAIYDPCAPGSRLGIRRENLPDQLPKGVEVYEIDGPFFFGIANKFDECMKTIGDKPLIRVIRMRKVPFMDTTGLHNLESLYRLSSKEKIKVILSGVNPEVRQVLVKSGFARVIGEENICPHIHAALDRAREMLQQEP